jgi:Fibronectin type III domain/Siphovirus protein of unknown function (DUF859)
MTSVTHDVSISGNYKHRIIIDQVSQNWGANTSQVRVRGVLVNTSGYRTWNLYNTIPRNITGTASYYPGPFGFDTPPDATYIDATFTITHDSEGYKTVSFTTYYGDTGVAFDGPSSCSASLTLDRIPKRPDPPGAPTFSNVLPTSLKVSWTASPDNNGSSITTYRLRRWTGPSQSGSSVDSDANNLSRNITNLIPGQTYTFAVMARNGASDNNGWSNLSGDNHSQLPAGVWIRAGGTWKVSIPYVRSGGIWKMARPYLRKGGIWKQPGA